MQEREAKYWDTSKVSLYVLPPEIQTLGATREYILTKPMHMGDEKVCLLDDDLTFFKRVSTIDRHLEAMYDSDFIMMFKWLEDVLDTYVHAGISAREGNNWEPNFVYNGRYMRCMAFNIKPGSPMADLAYNRFDGMSDFDINLQLLERGYPNITNFLYAHNQPGTQQPGGMTGQRTHESHSEECKRLAILHPGVVSLVPKKNKTGGEFGERMEVRIRWKLALKR